MFDIKNLFELGASLNTRSSTIIFQKRSDPIFPIDNNHLKPKEKRLIKVEMSFIDELSGLDIVKLFD